MFQLGFGFNEATPDLDNVLHRLCLIEADSDRQLLGGAGVLRLIRHRRRGRRLNTGLLFLRQLLLQLISPVDIPQLAIGFSAGFLAVTVFPQPPQQVEAAFIQILAAAHLDLLQVCTIIGHRAFPLAAADQMSAALFRPCAAVAGTHSLARLRIFHTHLFTVPFCLFIEQAALILSIAQAAPVSAMLCIFLELVGCLWPSPFLAGDQVFPAPFNDPAVMGTLLRLGSRQRSKCLYFLPPPVFGLLRIECQVPLEEDPFIPQAGFIAFPAKRIGALALMQ